MRPTAGEWHPWRYLREHPEIFVEWVRLYGRSARTNGVDLIEMDSRQRQVERRCSLTHEILHIEFGHVEGCDHPDEQRVVQGSARRLITIRALGRAVAWSGDRAEQADELWVVEDVLNVRLAHLHWSERGYLERATAHRREVV